MAESTIGLPPDSTGKALRTQTGGPNNSHMEVHVLADADGTLATVSTLAKDGTDGSGITQPTGGAGIRGWLSGIYSKLSGTLTVGGTLTTTPLGSVLSTLNSTSTPLTAGAPTYTGTWEDRLQWAELGFSIFADVASTADGFVVQYTNDDPAGTVTVMDSDVYTVPAANGQQIKISPTFRYFRVIYTTSATQAKFSLNSVKIPSLQKSSTHRASDTVDGNQDTDLTTALVKAQLSSGIYSAIRAMSTGALVADKPQITKGTPVTATTTTDTTVYTPAVGTTPRLKWVYITAGDDSQPNVVTLRWKTSGGVTTDIYTVDLTSPGVFAHAVNRDGPGVNATLVVGQSSARTIKVNVDMEDF